MVSMVKEIIRTDVDNSYIGFVIDQGKNGIMT